MKLLYISNDGGHVGLAQRTAEEGLDSFSFSGISTFRDWGFDLFKDVESWRQVITDVDAVALPPSFLHAMKAHAMAEQYKKALLWFDSALIKAVEYPRDLFEATGMLEEERYADVEAVPVRFSITGYWNGRDWADPVFVSFREDYSYPGDLGPPRVGMGTLTLPTEKFVLYDKTLGRLVPYMRKMDFRGFFEIDLIAKGSGFSPVAIHAPATWIVQEAIAEGLQDDLATLMLDTAFGQRKVLEVDNAYLIGVLVMTPPQPLELVVDGLRPEVLKHVFIRNLYRTDRGFVLVRGNSDVLTATARGRTVKEARKRARASLESVQVLDKIYRIDVGARVDRMYDSKESYLETLYGPFQTTWSGDLKQLKRWGWING